MVGVEIIIRVASSKSINMRSPGQEEAEGRYEVYEGSGGPAMVPRVTDDTTGPG